ncbi:MAG: cytochrome b [Rhodoferax sp.]|nr:cytochrome b [Rhodoferax sp.]
MNWKNTTDRYGSPSIGMHWLMFFLLTGAYVCINLADVFPKGSQLRGNLKTWHYLLGLCVWALVVIRLGIRFLSGPPPGIEPQISLWQRRLAGVMHVALYVFMIAMPLLGWLALSAKGLPIEIFGLQLPALIGPDKALAESIGDIHETIGAAGYYLIGMHAAAALFHHYVICDNTLVRMLPLGR